VATTCSDCFNLTNTPHPVHTVYLCVPHDSNNKQRLFP
jgi:hypothetical protein